MAWWQLHFVAAIPFATPKQIEIMEADQQNAISNSLSDLTNRTVELRRYL